MLGNYANNRRIYNFSCYCILMMASILVLAYNPVPVESSPAPGHLAIPYYIKQKEEKERLENDKLRIRCQSYIESGYYSDPRCEELYLQTYSAYGSGTTLTPSLVLSLVCVLRAIFH